SASGIGHHQCSEKAVRPWRLSRPAQKTRRSRRMPPTARPTRRMLAGYPLGPGGGSDMVCAAVGVDVLGEAVLAELGMRRARDVAPPGRVTPRNQLRLDLNGGQAVPWHESLPRGDPLAALPAAPRQ